MATNTRNVNLGRFRGVLLHFKNTHMTIALVLCCMLERRSSRSSEGDESS